MFSSRLRTSVDFILWSEQNSSLVVAKYLSFFDIKLHLPVNSVTSWSQSFLDQSLSESKNSGNTLPEMVFLIHRLVLLKAVLCSVKKTQKTFTEERIYMALEPPYPP